MNDILDVMARQQTAFVIVLVEDDFTPTKKCQAHHGARCWPFAM